jgi:hypothetical protein
MPDLAVDKHGGYPALSPAISLFVLPIVLPARLISLQGVPLASVTM